MTTEPLPYPILLPQRRPKDRTRGFIRAYAPILSTRDISAPTFLDFLETFNACSQASPWLQAINLASIGTIFMTPPLSIIVGIIIQQATRAAMELHSRSRTNRFLDKVNAGFFQPRGLYAVVLTWRPEDSGCIRQDIDVSVMVKTRATDAGTATTKLKNRFKASAGVTYGDIFTEVAPLVYPGLDALATQEGKEAEGKRRKLKAGKEVVSRYLDRRARATFEGQNPQSVLAGGPKEVFGSRYADPNHAACNGSIISLVTGGRFDAPVPVIGNMEMVGGGKGVGGRGGLLGNSRFGSGDDGEGGRGRGLRGEGRGLDRFEDRGLGRGESRGLNRFEGRGPGTINLPGPGNLLSGVKKVLQKDITYLMILDMPTKAEMAEATRVISEAGL